MTLTHADLADRLLAAPLGWSDVAGVPVYHTADGWCVGGSDVPLSLLPAIDALARVAGLTPVPEDHRADLASPPAAPLSAEMAAPPPSYRRRSASRARAEAAADRSRAP